MDRSARKLLVACWAFLLLTGFHHHHHDIGGGSGGGGGCGGTPEHAAQSSSSPDVPEPVRWTLSGEVDAADGGAVAAVKVRQEPGDLPVTDAAVRVNDQLLTQADPGTYLGTLALAPGAAVTVVAQGEHPVGVAGVQPEPATALALDVNALTFELHGPVARVDAVESDGLGTESADLLDPEEDAPNTVQLPPMFHRVQVTVAAVNEARSDDAADGSVELVDGTALLRFATAQ